MTQVKQRIEARLRAALSPSMLTVSDDSASHAGHAGNPHGAGESHFTVEIVSDAFTGQTRLARQRLVNKALAEELAGPVHALVIRAKAPGE